VRKEAWISDGAIDDEGNEEAKEHAEERRREAAND
jgi:hypothetical protein